MKRRFFRHEGVFILIWIIYIFWLAIQDPRFFYYVFQAKSHRAKPPADVLTSPDNQFPWNHIFYAVPGSPCFRKLFLQLMSSIFHFQMQQKEPWAKLYLFLVFALPYLRVRWPQRLQYNLRCWQQDSGSPIQKPFFLPAQQNDKMTIEPNPSLSSLEVWCQR